jgi:isocitrate dehydrogenase (NAD+)
VHGSAPDIAGKGIANPIALILSGAMMLDHVGMKDKGDRVRKAVDTTLNTDNVRTGDLGGKATTKQFTQAIIKNL